MSVQPGNETAAAPNWAGWQNAVINGNYPLQRLLHGSARSAVFLTERKGRADASAALKIIPIERITLAQLSHWKSATGLSHPHLLQLFDAGLCQLGGHQFLFVVMEYAEQTLSEVLLQRALTAEEVREMLPPILEALNYLHANGLVHGHLKPANILVVNDQLKLSSDSIRPVGAPRVGIAETSLYDPPEADHTAFSAAGDFWGLGMTLVEALTQSLPRFDEQPVTAGLPTSVPPALVDMVRRCLSADPAARPSATNRTAPPAAQPDVPITPDVPTAPQALATPVPQVVVPEASPPAAPRQESPRPRAPLPRFAALTSLILLAAVGAGWQLLRTHPNSTTAAQQPVVVPAVVSPQATAPAPAPATRASLVVHAQMPNVPRKALGTIHGHFRIVVLVIVDHSGMVIRGYLKNTGPSAYFARLTKEAAQQWRFAPTDAAGTRQWLLHFDFTHSGVTGDATPGS